MGEHMHGLVRDVSSAVRVRAMAVAGATFAVVIIDLLMPTAHLATRLVGATAVIVSLFERQF